MKSVNKYTIYVPCKTFTHLKNVEKISAVTRCAYFAISKKALILHQIRCIIP